MKDYFNNYLENLFYKPIVSDYYDLENSSSELNYKSINEIINFSNLINSEYSIVKATDEYINCTYHFKIPKRQIAYYNPFVTKWEYYFNKSYINKPIKYYDVNKPKNILIGNIDNVYKNIYKFYKI